LASFHLSGKPSLAVFFLALPGFKSNPFPALCESQGDFFTLLVGQLGSSKEQPCKLPEFLFLVFSSPAQE
jgi:hypothetical protein